MAVRNSIPLLLCLLGAAACGSPQADPEDPPEQFVRYESGTEGGAGKGRHIVLVSGDEEYRSEEGLPMLARMLSTLHGFRCTVLFAVDPETGIVNPHANTNIPGLSNLDDADLMVIQTRWRVLPDDQMAPIDRFLKAGKPVIALRTATHAFAPKPEVHGPIRRYLRDYRQAEDPESVPLPDIAPDAWSAYDHYGDGYTGPMVEWRDGFGRLVVGERWVAHHGRHKHESARGVIADGAADHALLRGVAPTRSGVRRMFTRCACRCPVTRCRWSTARSWLVPESTTRRMRCTACARPTISLLPTRTIHSCPIVLDQDLRTARRVCGQGPLHDFGILYRSLGVGNPPVAGERSVLGAGRGGRSSR